MEKKRFVLLISNQIIAHLIKISLIIGSPFLFFSAANCIIPLSGLFAGTSGLIVTYVIYLVKTICFSKTVLFSSVFGLLTLLRLPTLAASLYVYTENALFRTGVSLLCVMLFLSHPEGMYAPLYTLFWFVPLLLPLFVKNNLYVKFLSATLLQHAVGSVLFLYQNVLTAAEWHALIPTVFFERLLLSVGMYAAYIVMTALQHALETRFLPKPGLLKKTA